MINNLSILTTPSFESASTSDYSMIKIAVIKIYKNIVSTEDTMVDEKTPLSSLTGKQRQDFFEKVAEHFHIVYPKHEIMPTTIGETIQYVIDHKGDTISNRLASNTWDSAEFSRIKKRLDITMQMLANSRTSNENLNTGLLKIFIGVADLFLRVGNTFKTNLLKFYKSVKRSEIRYFSESHSFLCKNVENANIMKLMDNVVDVPSGMISSYKAAIDYIEDVYETLDLPSYANTLYKELQDVRRQLTRNEQMYRHGFKNTADSAARKTIVVRQIVATQLKYFSDNNQITSMPFKKAFGSMKEIKDARCKLIDMEKYLNDTKSLIDMVDNIDAIVGDISNYMTEDKEVDKQFIEQLINTIRYLATAFDTYGVCAMRQMALEHNLILIYESLYKSI